MAECVNVDMFTECGPDIIYDLEVTPWPWKTNSIDGVIFKHSLEHLGRDTQTFKSIIQELYRICKDKAEIYIKVPHPRHDHFINDPTHVRPITPELLNLFSKRSNLESIDSGSPDSTLAIYWNIDFDITEVTYTLDEPYASKFANKDISEDELNSLTKERNNVIKEITIVLTANK